MGDTVMEKQIQPDRLSVSYGRKINLGNYESADVHMSYSSDINDGESIEAAEARISKVVEVLITKKIKEVASGKLLK